MVILVVEDDVKMSKFIKKGLEFNHYTVETAYDGEEGLEKCEVNSYDVILLDVLLPKLDGVKLCRRLREAKIEAPIIMLTAKDTLEDRIAGLDAGADDYMVKPFSLNELSARIRAVLRREKLVHVSKLKVDDLVMDPAGHTVFRGERELQLSSREYRILEYMMRRAGRVCTRTMLGEHVWGFNFDVNKSNVIDTFISYLRKKVDQGLHNKLIHTIHDVGYKLESKGRHFNNVKTKEYVKHKRQNY